MRIDALTLSGTPQGTRSAGEPAPKKTEAIASSLGGANVAGDAVAGTQQHSPEPVTSVEAAARQIESYLKSAGRTLEFRVDADTQRTVVTVRDTASGEVIRQIPGDEVLWMARHLSHGSGGLVDLKI